MARVTVVTFDHIDHLQVMILEPTVDDHPVDKETGEILFQETVPCGVDSELAGISNQSKVANRLGGIPNG